MNFKTFLKESHRNHHAIGMFDGRTLDVQDIMAASINAGYHMSDEHQYWHSVSYSHFDDKTNSFVYNLVWFDPEHENALNVEDEAEEDQAAAYAVSAYFVSFDKNGKIVGEPAGTPSHDGLTRDEAVKAAKSKSSK